MLKFFRVKKEAKGINPLTNVNKDAYYELLEVAPKVEIPEFKQYGVRQCYLNMQIELKNNTRFLLNLLDEVKKIDPSASTIHFFDILDWNEKGGVGAILDVKSNETNWASAKIERTDELIGDLNAKVICNAQSEQGDNILVVDSKKTAQAVAYMNATAYATTYATATATCNSTAIANKNATATATATASATATATATATCNSTAIANENATATATASASATATAITNATATCNSTAIANKNATATATASASATATATTNATATCNSTAIANKNATATATASATATATATTNATANATLIQKLLVNENSVGNISNTISLDKLIYSYGCFTILSDYLYMIMNNSLNKLTANKNTFLVNPNGSSATKLEEAFTTTPTKEANPIAYEYENIFSKYNNIEFNKKSLRLYKDNLDLTWKNNISLSVGELFNLENRAWTPKIKIMVYYN